MASTIRGSDNFDTAGGNAVKAWVNFNGGGTVAISASYNVSSITDNGTGDYTVNFTTAMSDVNYSAAALNPAEARFTCFLSSTSNALRVSTSNATPTKFDVNNVSIAIFR